MKEIGDGIQFSVLILLIILFKGEPDIVDGIINYLMSF